MKLGSITLATGACVLAILAFAMGAEADKGTWSTDFDSCGTTDTEITADTVCGDFKLDLQGPGQNLFPRTGGRGSSAQYIEWGHDAGTAASVDVQVEGGAITGWTNEPWCNGDDRVQISAWLQVSNDPVDFFSFSLNAGTMQMFGIREDVANNGEAVLRYWTGPGDSTTNDVALTEGAWFDVLMTDIDCSGSDTYRLVSQTLALDVVANIAGTPAPLFNSALRLTWQGVATGTVDYHNIDDVQICVGVQGLCSPNAAYTTKAKATDPWAAVKTNHDPDNPLVYARYSYDGEDGARGHMVLMGEDLVNDATVNFCPDTQTGVDSVPYDRPGALGVDGQGTYAYASCTITSFAFPNREGHSYVDAGTLTWQNTFLTCPQGKFIDKYDALGGTDMVFYCDGNSLRKRDPLDTSTDWGFTINIEDFSADTVSKKTFTITATHVAAYSEQGTSLGSFIAGGEHIAAYDDVVFIIDGNRLERWTTTGSPTETHSYTLTDSGSRNGGLDTTKDGTYVFAQDNDKFCLWLATDLSLVACYTIPDVSGTNAVQDYDVDFLNTYAYVATEDDIVQFDIAFATSAWGTTNNTFPTGTTNPGGASGSTGLIGAGNSPDPNQGAADQCEGDPTFLGLDICSGIDADGDGSAEVSGTAFAWLIGFFSLVAWTASFWMIGSRLSPVGFGPSIMLGSIGAFVGLVFNVAFNLWPFWVAVFMFMLAAGALALRIRPGGGS